MKPRLYQVTSTSIFSDWHTTHGQARVEGGFPDYVPWWVALCLGWQRWGRVPDTLGADLFDMRQAWKSAQDKTAEASTSFLNDVLDQL